MVDNETLIKLRSMHLSGMAECSESLASLPQDRGYSAPEVVKLICDHEWDRRQSSKLRRLQKRAGLAQPFADVCDIRMVDRRRIDTELIARLAIGGYLMKHQDVVLQGTTGSGKTFVACALANKACQQFKKVLYLTAADLIDRLTIVAQGTERRRALDALVAVELLVVDDWFLRAPTAEQAQNLHVLVDRRHQRASTIFCTQLSPSDWHDQIEEKVIADAIVDRITTNSHTMELDCADSLRRVFSTLDY
ncbi:MAG: ATP-binding protein [Coriobacteriaceae bacterium]|jgi:DNA replication protein DnaC|nr:ATP-binding protein [Coriobacteriaceae bacterium]